MGEDTNTHWERMKKLNFLWCWQYWTLPLGSANRNNKIVTSAGNSRNSLYMNVPLSLCSKYCGKWPSIRPSENNSYVSSHLIAIGMLQNLQLDVELKTSALHLLYFVVFVFFPPQKLSRQQPLFTLSLIYYSLFLISPIFAGQLGVGGREGTRKKKNQWLDEWKCRVSVCLWAANGDSGEQNKHRTNRDGLPGN